MINLNNTTPAAAAGGQNVLFQSDVSGNVSAYLVTSTSFVSAAARVSTQFDKTTDTTLANIPGLTVTLTSGLSYQFRAYLHMTANVTGGSKTAIAGTATATSIIYQTVAISDTSNLNVIADRQVALAGSVGQAGATVLVTIIEGLITCNAGGTLTVTFAQNVSNGTSSVLVGSTLFVNTVN